MVRSESFTRVNDTERQKKKKKKKKKERVVFGGENGRGGSKNDTENESSSIPCLGCRYPTVMGRCMIQQ